MAAAVTTSNAFDFGDEGEGGFDEDMFDRKFQEFVARKVQAVWRGKQVRKQYLAERRAAQFIQAQFRTSERKRAVSRRGGGWGHAAPGDMEGKGVGRAPKHPAPRARRFFFFLGAGLGISPAHSFLFFCFFASSPGTTHIIT